jgi:hypothetical protein
MLASGRRRGGQPGTGLGARSVRLTLELAALLEVRLYDHTRWFGMRRVDAGRLAYDPTPGPRGQDPVTRPVH